VDVVQLFLFYERIKTEEERERISEVIQKSLLLLVGVDSPPPFLILDFDSRFSESHAGLFDFSTAMMMMLLCDPPLKPLLMARGISGACPEKRIDKTSSL
jgi:hypothetical protein